MARLSLVFGAAGVLLLVAMAAVADASTIVTTTTFDENRRDTSGSESGCYQQIAEQEMLSHCGMYLMKSLGGSQGSRRIGGRAEDHLQLCCMQLQNVGEECMCPGIRMMLNQPMWRMMGQMTDQMMSVAQSLPTECNLGSQPCQMRAVWV